ncbi:MAG: hypothetical protein GX541_01020, partial [Clostridiales bacterium]|nr:hypothetical protein [Clostridiales bacterium]
MSVTLRGVTVTDSVNITVTDSLPMSAVSSQYIFKRKAYAGDMEEDFDARIAPFNNYTEARPWAYVADSMPEGPSTGGGNLFGAVLTSAGVQIGRAAYGTVSTDWIAFKIKVPESGRYKASLTYYGMKNNGIADIHIAPLTQAALNNPKSIVSPDTKIGTVDFYQDVQNLYYTAELGELSLTDEEFTASDGECLLVFQCVGRRAGATGHAFYISSLLLDGIEISSAGLEVSQSEFKVTKTAVAQCSPVLNTGELLKEGYTVKYSSSAPGTARIDESTGVINGISPGTAEITAEITYKYQTLYERVIVTVLPQTEILSEITLTYNRTTIAAGQSVTGYVAGKLADGDDAVLTDAEIVYTSSAPEIAEVSETGYVTCKTEGEAVITVQVTLREVTVTDSVTFTVTPALSDEPAHVFKAYSLSGTSRDCIAATYAASDGVWQIAGYDETMEKGALSNNNFFGMKAALNAGQWFSVMVTVPAAGRYRIGLTYAARSDTGGVGNIYFAPYNGTSAYMWRNPEYYVNQLSFADTAGAMVAGGTSDSGYVKNATTQLGEVDVEVPGEYVITFESAPVGGKYIFLSEIILDGTDEAASLESVSADIGKPVLYVGQPVQVSMTANLSDGSRVTGTLPGVKMLGRSINMAAASLTPAILSVDETGFVNALAPGEGQIKVSASMSGVTHESNVSITAKKTPNYSGRKESYVFKPAYYSGDTDADRDARISPFTDYTQERHWAYIADSMPEGPSRGGGNLAGAYFQANGLQIGRSAYSTTVQNDWIAFKIRVPAAGRYSASISYIGMTNNGILDVHMISLNKADLSNIAANINEETRIGTFDSYESVTSKVYTKPLGNAYLPYEGDYLLIFKQVGKNPSSNGSAMYLNELLLDGDNPGDLKSLTVSTTDGNSELEPGDTAQIVYNAYSAGGLEIDLAEMGLVPEIINRTPELISIDSTGVVTAKETGIAKIEVSVFLDGVTIIGSLELYVTDFSEIQSVELTPPPFVSVRGKARIQPVARVASGKTIPVPQSAMTYTIVSAEPEGAATVDENGYITGIKKGSVTIKGVSSYRGKILETPEITVSVGIKTKTRSTIYTPEKREIARENIKKYSWAKAEADAVINTADKYADNTDILWNLIVAEGLPRFYHNGEAADPEQGLCRYCKYDIAKKYGQYPYLFNALTNPWKIQCPICKRRFPSNDFGKYYKSGLDEHG